MGARKQLKPEVLEMIKSLPSDRTREKIVPPDGGWGSGDLDASKEYQREYYLAHKEEIAQRRKQKYQTDPECKAKVRMAGIERRKRERREREAEREKVVQECLAAGLPVPPRTNHHRGPRQPVNIFLGGSYVPAYTIATVSARVKRSVEALNLWILAGMIPKTPFVSKRRERLYTDSMIDVIAEAISQEKIVGTKNERFRNHVREGWEKLGVNFK